MFSYGETLWQHDGPRIDRVFGDLSLAKFLGTFRSNENSATLERG